MICKKCRQVVPKAGSKKTAIHGGRICKSCFKDFQKRTSGAVSNPSGS